MPIQIVKAQSDRLDDVQMLLDEYYEALEIQKRDTPEETERFLDSSSASESKIGVWIAYDETTPIGCVVLRLLDGEEQKLAEVSPSDLAGEVKRLFVRNSYRGRRVAQQMIDTLEAFATKSRIHWIYLDSKDDLYAALNLYRHRGYENCPRYNVNPQATVFLRKRLAIQR